MILINPIISTLLIISSRSHLIAAKSTNLFVELTEKPYFVDKTELLGAILEPLSNIFISMPSGFFKTSNLQMIRSFLQLEFDNNNNPKNFTDTETLKFFSRFEIAKGTQNVIQNHMANYSVLFMDLKYNISQITKSMKDVENLLETKLREAYQEYDEVLTKLPQPLGEFNLTQGEIKFLGNLRRNKSSENRFELIYQLQNLCSILYKYFRRPVVILIDNYDYAADEIVSKRYDFISTESSVHYFYTILNEMLCRALKDVREFERYAIVTGVGGYIAYADRFLRKNPYFLNRNHSQNLARFFSFTEEEVDGLVARYQCNKNEIAVKKYYKGHLEGTYNPYSIIRYLEFNSSIDQEGTPKLYWTQRKSKEFIKQALKSTSFRLKIQLLVDKRSAMINLTTLPDDENEFAALNALYRIATEIEEFKGVWQFEDEYLFRYLSEIGYFYLDLESSSTRNLYRIPNEEIYEALRDVLASTEEPKNETLGFGTENRSDVVMTTLLPD